MILEHTFQDYVEMTGAIIGDPVVYDDTMRVPVQDIIIFAGYQDFTQDTRFRRCVLVFEGVGMSVRSIVPDEQNRTKPLNKDAEYFVTDGPFLSVQKLLFQFNLNGKLDRSRGYVDWYIICNDVHVEDGVVW